MHTKFLNLARTSSAINILDTTTKDTLLKTLSSKYNEIVPRKSWKEFEENDIGRLQKGAYCVSLRTHGNPYFILLTRLNFTNTCVFVDKKVRGEQGHCYPRMLITHIQFADELFQRETLLEGEMVRTNDNDWVFLFSDIIGIDGERLTKTNLPKRLHILNDILENKFTQDRDMDPCDFQLKYYCTYDYLNHLIYEFAPSLPYQTKGIVFKPLHLAQHEILYTFASLSQDKPKEQKGGEQKQISSENHKAILTVVGTDMPDLFQLYEPSSQNFKGYACVPSKETSELLRETFTNRRFAKVDMFCEFSSFFGSWIPKSA